MAIDPRLLQAPGKAPQIYSSVADLDRRVRQLEAARSTIGAGTIQGGPTGMIANGAITAELIDVGAINTGHLQANSVSTVNLQADSVTALKIATDAIETRHMKADQITAVKIATDAIETRHLSAEVAAAGWLDAGVITSDKLLVSSGGNNLLKNGHFARVTGAAPDYWSLYNSNLSPAGALDTIASASARYGPRMARLINSTDTSGNLGLYGTIGSNEAPAVPNKSYTLTAWVQPLAGSSNWNVQINWIDSGGSTISASASASNVASSGSWTKVKVTATSPALTAKARPYVWVTNPASGATYYVGAMLLQDGDLPSEYLPAVDEILPGTIIGEHIGALTIDTGHLKAASIDTTKLQADIIDTVHLKTDSVDARVIKADAVTSIEIQSGAVQTGHMTAGTITGDRITTDTLHGDKITATSILATKLNVSQLSAITANMGTLTAGTITGATFQTANPGTNPRASVDSTGVKLTNSAGVITFHADTATGKVVSLAGLGGGNLVRQTAPTAADIAVLQRWTGSNPTTPVLESTVKFGDYNTWKHTANGAGIAVIYNDYLTDNIVTVEPGEELVVSGYFRTSVASRFARVRIVYYDAADVSVGSFSSSIVAIPVDTWTRLDKFAAAPAGSVRARVLFDFGTSGMGTPTSGDVWYLGGAQMERGRLPTSYNPKVDEILANTVTGVEVAPGSIEGTANSGDGHIATDTVGVNEIFVTNLAAINADLGTITAGTITATASVNAAAVNAGVMSADRITLQVGVANLLAAYNPSFEDTDITGWTASTGTSARARVVNPAAYGNATLQVTADGSTTYSQVHFAPSGDPGIRTGIRENKPYSFSSWVKSNTSNRQFRMLVIWYNDSDVQVGSTLQSSLVSVPNDLTWTRATFENQVAPAGTTQCRLYLRLSTTSGNTGAGETWWTDAVQINEGEKAAAFTHFGPDQILRTQILPGEVRANHIGADQVDATHINVSTLDAISANIGTITAGTITATVSVHADAVQATTLSAIAADVGVLTAGVLEGPTIRTGPTSAARVSLEAATGLRAFSSSTNETFRLNQADGTVSQQSYAATILTGTQVFADADTHTFEADIGNWTVGGSTPATLARSTLQFHSGVASGLATYPHGASFIKATGTAYTFLAGRTYQFSIWARPADLNASAYLFYVTDNTNSITFGGSKINDYTPNVWQKFVVDFVPTANCTSVSVQLSVTAISATATINIDDLRIVDLTPGAANMLTLRETVPSGNVVGQLASMRWDGNGVVKLQSQALTYVDLSESRLDVLSDSGSKLASVVARSDAANHGVFVGVNHDESTAGTPKFSDSTYDEYLLIDYDGRSDWLQEVGDHVSVSKTTMTATTITAWTAIPWATEDYDTYTLNTPGVGNGMWDFSVNNSRLTAKKAGIYSITAHIYFAANSGGVHRLIGIRKNGTDFLVETGQVSSGFHASGVPRYAAATLAYLNVGDYVELVTYQDAVANLNAGGASATEPARFGMSRIGDNR